MFSGSLDAGFVLALPIHHRDLEPDCGGRGGLMRGIKIPPQDFALKMQGGGGGLCARGGIFAGHYGKYEIFTSKTTIIETTCAVNGF